MHKITKNKRFRNFLSVIAGSFCPFLMGLILYPIVRIIFEKYFHLFDTGGKNDALIISVTLALWMLFSSITGGLTAILVAKNNEWLYTFLSAATFVIIINMLTQGAIFEDASSDSMLLTLMIPAGFLIGGIIGAFIIRKRRKKPQSLISNTPSFQTDTAEQ